MLSGDARKFHFQILKEKNLNLITLVNETRARFQTKERTQALLLEWDDMTLNNVRRANLYKNLSEFSNQLTSLLSGIQCYRPEQYRGNVITRDKLLNAIRDTSACGLAYQKPTSTLRGVIANLQASVATSLESVESKGPIAIYVDSRRHNSSQIFQHEKKTIVPVELSAMIRVALCAANLDAGQRPTHFANA